MVALPTIPVYIHLPTLYGIQLGIGLATTGYILLITRLFDTVTDPLVGFLCDRLEIWNLRRKPWIALGAIIAGIGLYKILNPVDDVTGSYLMIWSLVLFAGWTMVAVPCRHGCRARFDYNERTHHGLAEGFGLLGIVGAGRSGPHRIAWLVGKRSIGTIAWSAIALGIVVIPFASIRSRIRRW